MRKLIATLLLCTFPGFAALPSTLQWDVRTGGSNNNGGAFDPSVASPGTDFSQQNSAQIAYTDLVISVTTTNYTSVLNVVASNVVGNTIQIISGTGCTAGFYNIRSETASTPNFATVDRSMGTAASVCVANLGGSLATPGQGLNNMTSGNTVWATGSYVITTGLSSASSSGGRFSTLAGYTATHGDGGKVTITTSSAITMLNPGGDAAYLNLSITGISGQNIFVPGSGRFLIKNSLISVPSGAGGIYSNNQANQLWFIGDEWTGAGPSIQDTGGSGHGLYVYRQLFSRHRARRYQ